MSNNTLYITLGELIRRVNVEISSTGFTFDMSELVYNHDNLPEFSIKKGDFKASVYNMDLIAKAIPPYLRAMKEYQPFFEAVYFPLLNMMPVPVGQLDNIVANVMGEIQQELTEKERYAKL